MCVVAARTLCGVSRRVVARGTGPEVRRRAPPALETCTWDVLGDAGHFFTIELFLTSTFRAPRAKPAERVLGGAGTSTGPGVAAARRRRNPKTRVLAFGARWPLRVARLYLLIIAPTASYRFPLGLRDFASKRLSTLSQGVSRLKSQDSSSHKRNTEPRAVTSMQYPASQFV